MQLDKFNLQSAVKVVYTKWKQLILFVILALMVASTTIIIIPKKYYAASYLLASNPSMADKSSLLHQHIQNLYSNFGSSDDLERIMGIASMDTIFNQLVDEFHLVQYYDLKGEEKNILRRKAMLALKDDIMMQKTDWSQLKISIWTNNAELSAQLINRLVALIQKNLESIWSNDYRTKYMHLKLSIDSLNNEYASLALKIDKNNSGIASIDRIKANTLQDLIESQQKTAAEYKLALENINPACYVLETAVPAARAEKPEILKILIITAIASTFFGIALLLFLNRELEF
jgi:hypothetical protein